MIFYYFTVHKYYLTIYATVIRSMLLVIPHVILGFFDILFELLHLVWVEHFVRLF